MRAVLLVGCLTACGRLGFDYVGGGGDDALDDARRDTPSGPKPTIVNTVRLPNSVGPRVAWNGQAFVAFWGDDIQTMTAYATYSTDGTVQTQPRPIALGFIYDVIEMSDGVAVLHSATMLSLARIDRAGTVSSNVAIASTDSADVALNTQRNELCVAWADYSMTPRRVFAARTSLTGQKIGGDLITQPTGDISFRPIRVGCAGDELYVLWGSNVGEERVYYRAFTGTAELVPETRVIASAPGQLSLHTATLAAPNLPQPLVAFSLTGAGGVRVSRFDLAAATVLAGEPIQANSHAAVTTWSGDKLLLGFEEYGMPGGTYLATFSSNATLDHVPVLLGAELPDIYDPSSPSSIAFSPSGHIAVGVSRYDSLTFEGDSFISFLAPP